ncbi:MAG: TatD family deoxyribonuclease [Geminicoccaceae bacterium]|nr:MAG: TatD family deoxyribonuclease [Geminicoccaceae bacterium]
MLVDSHCHLDFPQLAEQEDAVIARAHAAGVSVMQTICTKLTKADDVLALVERQPSVVAAMGVHPHHTAAEGLTEPARLLELAQHPKVTAIGETGLDYHYDYSPRDAQVASFRAHIEAARQTGLPLVVHTRSADADTAAILAEEMARGPFTGVVHCYSSSAELGRHALELGLHLGIGGVLTFPRSDALRAIVEDLPLDRLILETDAPYLAPPPHRGRTNEPAYIPLIAAVLAKIKGEPMATVERATTATFFRLFPKAEAARPCG